MPRVAALVPGTEVRIRGARWRVIRETRYEDASIVEVDSCDRAGRGGRARFLLPAERIEPVPTDAAARVVSPSRWRHVARRAIADAVPSFDSLLAAPRADLDVLPFQLEPALAYTRGLATRMLLADEVGLGKTIQAGLVIAEMLERTPDGRALVVCPPAVRDQWRHELRSRFSIESSVLASTELARAAAGHGHAFNPWIASAVSITSIDYVKRPEVIRGLEPLVWDALVFDEAHWLTGSSERAAAARALARRARMVILLSATPHSGDDAAFAALCRIGALPEDPPILLFRRTGRDAGVTRKRRESWLRVRQSDAERALHRQLMDYAQLVWRQAGADAHQARLAMCVLVKRAASSAAALALSLERRLGLLTAGSRTPDQQPRLPFEADEASDDEPLAALATPGLADSDQESAILENVLTLARNAAVAQSKLHALTRLLRRSAEPAIVFTEYRDTLAHIANALTGVSHVRLHGGLTAIERREALECFADGHARVLLATDAASEGLNLHHRCRLVVNMELPWTPVRLEQRIGRVDRIGQRATVHAVHLVGRDTAEEHTVARILGRASRARGALRGGAMHDEAVMGRAVIGGEVWAPPSVGPETEGRFLPADTAPVFADLDVAARARDEAARILASRAVRPLGVGAIDARPVLTVFATRRALRVRRRCYRAYRLAFQSDRGEPIWATLVALEHASPERRSRAARDVRAALANASIDVSEALALRHRSQVSSISAAIDRFRGPAVRRMQDIAADLRAHRARLATLQPGLFDRRAERARSDQLAVLEAALDRCALRLGRLDTMGPPIIGPRELVFVVAID